jgi:hypothetical protein
MGAILRKLWNDPDYFRKSMSFVVAMAAVILPILPLGELGPTGYWLGKLALPIAIAIGATSKGSGLSADEASKLRALIPTQAQLDRALPPVAMKTAD